MFDIQKWLKVFDFRNLDAFFSSEKGKGGVGGALGRVLVSKLMFQLPYSALSALALLTGGTATVALTGALIGVAIGFGFEVVATLVLFVLIYGTQHLIAGMLGGKGTLANFFHLQSFVMAAVNLVMLLMLIPSVLGLIPGVGAMIKGGLNCIFLPFLFVVGLYSLFVTYKSVQVAYGLDSGKAIVAIVLNVVLWVIILVILGIILVLVGMAALFGAGTYIPKNIFS